MKTLKQIAIEERQIAVEEKRKILEEIEKLEAEKDVLVNGAKLSLIALFKTILMFIIGICFFLTNAYIISKIWLWFFVEPLGFFHADWKQACAIMIVSAFLSKHKRDKSEDLGEDYVRINQIATKKLKDFIFNNSAKTGFLLSMVLIIKWFL